MWSLVPTIVVTSMSLASVTVSPLYVVPLLTAVANVSHSAGVLMVMSAHAVAAVSSIMSSAMAAREKCTVFISFLMFNVLFMGLFYD